MTQEHSCELVCTRFPGTGEPRPGGPVQGAKGQDRHREARADGPPGAEDVGELQAAGGAGREGGEDPAPDRGREGLGGEEAAEAMPPPEGREGAGGEVHGPQDHPGAGASARGRAGGRGAPAPPRSGLVSPCIPLLVFILSAFWSPVSRVMSAPRILSSCVARSAELGLIHSFVAVSRVEESTEHELPALELGMTPGPNMKRPIKLVPRG